MGVFPSNAYFDSEYFAGITLSISSVGTSFWTTDMIFKVILICSNLYKYIIPVIQNQNTVNILPNCISLPPRSSM